MCIVIDTNTLSHVFNEKDEKHPEFKPVRDWIVNGQGKVVFGGTKYIAEIGPRLIPVLLALRTANKAVRVSDSCVNGVADEISKVIQHDDFDDQHIVALLMKSGCKLVCSLDVRAYPYFQHMEFFGAGKRPKIYSGSRNADLLCNSNIAQLCMPCVTLNKQQKEALGLG